jgi:vanillate/3-O-methylgallate O-demethylase
MVWLGVVAPKVQVSEVLILVWSEPDGGTASTERRRQAEIRVRIASTPYAKEARERYAESWRALQPQLA